MNRRIVCNASPLIALSQIGELEVLHLLFGVVLVPSAVQLEIAPTLPVLPAWIEVQELTSTVPLQILNARLGAGESETMALGLEADATQIVLDDLAARRLARSLALNVIGTIGVLHAARLAAYISPLKPRLDALLDVNFHLAPKLYDQVLRDVSEL